MIFAKTFCNPGSYVEVVPAGLLVTLQYNSHGILEKVYDGYDRCVEFNVLSYNNIKTVVPRTIPLNGGTTYVEGVLYTPEIPKRAEGTIPSCYFNAYIQMLSAGRKFEFLAGNVESKAANFKGALIIRNWLSMAGFTLLPGLVSPTHFTDFTLQQALKASSRNISYPYIAGFFVFEDLTQKYVPANLKQIVVSRVEDHIDTNGYMHCSLYSQVISTVHVSYSDYIHKDIQEGSSVLYSDASGIEIAYVLRNIDGKHREPLSSVKECPICHKTYRVPTSGATICDDPNCLSRSYPRVQKMLNVLGLPELSYSDYMSNVAQKNITIVSDVLLLPQYKDITPEINLAQALEAGTPVAVCPDSSFFTKFANNCNDSVEAAMYYMKNPLRIPTDLEMTTILARQFANWIAIPENLITMQAVFGTVHIVPRAVTFNCAPIFRGQHIVVTGKFLRGNYNRISAILEGCGATVSSTIEDKIPDVVVTGSTYEGISGDVIQQAKMSEIPVYDENTFFSYYELDSDIAQNLL